MVPDTNLVQDDAMKIVFQITAAVLQRLTHLTPVAKPQQRFVQVLLSTLLTVRGKVNFLNLSRYCALSERTLRRQFRQPFAWPLFNRLALAPVLAAAAPQIVAQDASFIAKSGQKTYGLDTFFNGCAGHCEKGLEVSLVSLIDVAANTGYALSVQQTPPTARPATAKTTAKTTAKMTAKMTAKEDTRTDFYLQHLQEVRPLLPDAVQCGVFDGYFAKRKFVDGVCALKLHLVSKLRCDADLDYLYTGPQIYGAAEKVWRAAGMTAKCASMPRTWSSGGRHWAKCSPTSSYLRFWPAISRCAVWCGCCCYGGSKTRRSRALSYSSASCSSART